MSLKVMLFRCNIDVYYKIGEKDLVLHYPILWKPGGTISYSSDELGVS